MSGECGEKGDMGRDLCITISPLIQLMLADTNHFPTSSFHTCLSNRKASRSALVTWMLSAWPMALDGPSPASSSLVGLGHLQVWSRGMQGATGEESRWPTAMPT